VRSLRRREPEQFDRLEFLPGEEMQVGRVGQRKLWGIVGLAERYPRRLVHSYRHVKVLTEKLVADALAVIDNAAVPAQGELALTQEHPLIKPQAGQRIRQTLVGAERCGTISLGGRKRPGRNR